MLTICTYKVEGTQVRQVYSGRKGGFYGRVQDAYEAHGRMVAERFCAGAATQQRAFCFNEGARHDRVRNTRRRAGCYCHFGNNDFQAQTARVMERHCRGHKRAVAQLLCRDEQGQSTLEFAVVMSGFLCVTVALSLLWHALGDGLLVQHALACASHHVQAVLPTTVADIFLY